ncbi:MAG: hypothetical protein EPN38_05715 [Rhodanobacteraceae bacterium]|nr:MAG: hypothetical protein EPN38_05715 [Rhodanobacteraceae bacterium]
MSPFAHSRIAALGFALAAASLMAPAFAGSPVNVTFQANNHWAQEVDDVGHYDSSHDYVVTIGAGKILQVNLVSRNPNVFFRVKDTAADKQLIDSYTTGATTWSTGPVAAATNYLIHVYVQPAAIGRDDKAKYALQIGQYGPEDIKAPATDVTFEDGKPWTQMVGSLDSAAAAHDYNVAMAAGKTLQVNLITHNPKVHFAVTDQATRQKLVDTATTGAATWSGQAPAAATYTVHVYANAADVPPGTKAGFALQIGQFGGAGSAGQAAPAGAATAAPAGPAPSGSGSLHR